MNISKLFRVLVIGGAMLGCDEPEVPPTDTELVTDAGMGDAMAGDAMRGDAMPTDSGMSEPDATATDSGGPAAPMNGGFCPNEIGCDEDGEPRDGFECCWGTSC